MEQQLSSRARRLVWMALAAAPMSASAQAVSVTEPPAPAPAAALSAVSDPSPAGRQMFSSQDWALHGQATNVTQWHGRFRSFYSGTNSLPPDGRTEETTDVTLYGGGRLWKGAELWLNPEYDQGRGLDNTVGIELAP